MHLPESVVSDADGIDAESRALLADSIGPALLVILHTLAPAERLAFVLHDMFAVPFDDIAAVVGRSPAAARASQMARIAPRIVPMIRPMYLVCAGARSRSSHARRRKPTESVSGERCASPAVVTRGAGQQRQRRRCWRACSFRAISRSGRRVPWQRWQ